MIARVRQYRPRTSMVRNAMKKGLLGGRLRVVHRERPKGGPFAMLYAGLDLSRKRLDFHLLDEAGETVEVGAAPPDADGLRGLAAPRCSPSASRCGRRSSR